MPVAGDRIASLKKFKSVVLDRQNNICSAIDIDFNGRSYQETFLGEILPVIGAINQSIKNVKKWMKISKRSVEIQIQPAKAYVMYQPLGVVGIVVPWNYPFMLAASPLVGAITAGNKVMIKMSEYVPETFACFLSIINECFSSKDVCVVQGDAKKAALFTSLNFDHLLFTGSTHVGKMVMESASKQLTPVTLELGGKSPVVIDEDFSASKAAELVCFGKSFNAGQTCIAPDYVLCPDVCVQSFLESCRAAFQKMYPSAEKNSDYTSVFNEKQFKRLEQMLDDARCKGGIIHHMDVDFSSSSHRMPLYLITNVSDDMIVMEEEIFGPILPIITYADFQSVISYINDRSCPLALYYLGHNSEHEKQILNQTHSGGVCINDTLTHVAVEDLPFGGVGHSGMGHYHGHEGFLTFSKAKAVLTKGKLNSSKLVYPPYIGWIYALLKKFFLR